ncbi:MAG TPA: hypothetical protein VFX82_06560 [Desulfobacterales bacterium]|nr:hypothetical protein [Desulfobacterales bacterium]
MKAGLLLLCTALLFFFCPGREPGAADAIYFKDGMRTVCHGRAWEENGQVHCEYDGGILIYPSADVDRIEKGPEPRPQLPEAPPPSAPQASPAIAPAPASAQPAKTVTQPAPGGVPFYDPRRTTQKYWSRSDRRHDTFPEAVAALAEEFERPAKWVEENMGDANDLAIIRETLSGRKQDVQSQTAGSQPDSPAGVEFYNPRRPEIYWTGPDSRHKNYAEAIQVLAREFDKPADWVERFMGESNDTEEIRTSLRGALKSGAN